MARTNKHLPLSIAIAVVVHVGAFMLLALGYQVKQERESTPHKVINTVKAKVIDEAELVENQRRREEALRRKELERQQQLAEQKRLEQQRLKQAEKEKRLQDELEAERKKARLAEQKAERERKRAEEARKQAEIERKRLAEEKRRVAEQKKAAEAKRRAELKKKKAAEAKRQAELKKKKAAEAKRLAELKKRKEQEQAAIDRQRLASLEQEEAELNAEAQRVLRARERSRLIAEYQDAIRNKIERNWRKPLDYQADDQCRVLVLQSLGGHVNDVVVENCTGNDEFRDSVEKAVWKADPLPEPPTPELFDREVLFTFSPKSS